MQDSPLERALRIVDERFGVVRQLTLHEVGPEDPPLFYATAHLASTVPISDVRAATPNGGAGWDPQSAAMGALGEAIERYGIGRYRERNLERGAYAELRPVAMDPRRLTFFADCQYAWERFPYARVDAATTLSWVAGTSLSDGSIRLVPAVRVYTPYRAPRPCELIMQSTSTGAACHGDRERATLHALYECIERDAFTIAWLNRMALPRVHVEDAELTEALDMLERRGLAPMLLDATLDLPCPTVVCVLRGRDGRVPSVAFGAATRGTLRAAAWKALTESAHTWFWIHTRAVRGQMLAFGERPPDVWTLDEHALLYGDPRMRDRPSFLWAPVPTRVAARKESTLAAVPMGERAPSAELQRCVAALHAGGLDAVVVDLTPPDVQALGFVVVRVVVADLHPLSGGHHVRCLGGARVRQLPVRMGYADAEPALEDLNGDPHPMP